MNKFNKIGMEVLEYKRELSKDNYPELVRKALTSAIDQLQLNEVIDVDVHYSLKDNDVALDAFKELLLAKKNMVKSAEELLKEYELTREVLDSKLRNMDLLKMEKDLAPVMTESKVAEEQIHIISSFRIDSTFAADYFGKSEPDELDILMKRKGFVERFVVLRYNKMMNDFLSEHDNFDADTGSAEVEEGIFISASPVYFEPESNSYCSEFMIYLDVETVEDEGEHERILAVAEREIKEINDYIRIRTIA